MHRPRIMYGCVHVLYLHPVVRREASGIDQLPAPSRPTENEKGGEKRLRFDTTVRGLCTKRRNPSRYHVFHLYPVMADLHSRGCEAVKERLMRIF